MSSKSQERRLQTSLTQTDAPAYNGRMRKSAFLILISLLVCLVMFLPAQKKKSPKDLPPQYRKWLQEEVVYIITAKERDVFLQLESDREREIFIDAFWKARNPNPTSAENAFKKEHYRRIQYANQWFGKDSPGPGWRTDMGRIYIILGEPKQIEKFENLPEVFPMIVWFFDGMAEFGLPNAFSVVYFKREGTGEYILYSPIRYGPQYLLIHYKGDQANYVDAYNQLFAVEPSLADLSLSLVQGETRYSLTPSLSSEVLLNQKIPAAPYEKVKDAYAEKLLKYKGVIEVDYTANWIDNESLIKVFQDPKGNAFVHFSVELAPEQLTFEEIQGRYRTTFEINGSVTDPQGQMIYQFSRNVPIEMVDEQFAKIKSKLFSYQDMFPLIPGRYKFNLLLKNIVSKQFTSVEADLFIPEPTQLSMSAPVLANKINRESKFKGMNKPFLLGNVQLVPSPRNDFQRGETLYLFFQLHGLPANIRDGGVLEYTILKETEKIQSLTKGLKEYPSQTNFFEEFSLANYSPANYKIKVALLGPARQEIVAAEIPFYITPRISLPRPWILSTPQPTSDDPSFPNILGNQYFNKQDLAKAKALIEIAYRTKPSYPPFALDFCRVLYQMKDYKGVIETATPFLEGETRYEFLQIAGQSLQAMGQLAEAAALYKDYLSHFGTNIFILNAVGECYYQLGNAAEALFALEKSLELNPNQEKIKALVKTLKEKK
jgi:GWxTD domain-containing protein